MTVLPLSAHVPESLLAMSIIEPSLQRMTCWLSKVISLLMIVLVVKPVIPVPTPVLVFVLVLVSVVALVLIEATPVDMFMLK